MKPKDNKVGSYPEKNYKVRVAVTIAGEVEVCASSKEEAKRKAQETFDSCDFCDVRHNMRGVTQLNFVPISYVRPVSSEKSHA